MFGYKKRALLITCILCILHVLVYAGAEKEFEQNYSIFSMNKMFSDIEYNCSYRDAVELLLDRNVISIEDGGQFRGEEAITKQEMLEWLNHIANTKISEELSFSEMIAKAQEVLYGPKNQEDVLKNVNIRTRADGAMAIKRLIEADGKTAFYVDGDNGDDSNLGSESKPFKTIERARNEVRKVNKQMTNDIYIYINDGTYFLFDTIRLNQRDSGYNGHFVVYKGVNGCKPVISGGQVISNWELFDKEKNIYKADAKGLVARDLYVNGKRSTLARSKGGLSDVVLDNEQKGFTTTDLTLLDFKHVQDVTMVFYHVWAMSRINVADVKKSDSLLEITMAQPHWAYKRRGVQADAKEPLYYENAFELLDEPGEFFIDKYENAIYYIPEANEDIFTAETIIPKIETLIDVSSDTMETPVKNVIIKNLSFEHTVFKDPFIKGGCAIDLDIPDAMGAGYCSDFTAALRMRTISNCGVLECEFSKTDGRGLHIIRGANGVLVEGCEVHDTGADGMRIGDTTARTTRVVDSRLKTQNVTVRNNYFHDLPATWLSGQALHAHYISGFNLMHNKCIRTPYTGFWVGTGMAYVSNPVQWYSDLVDNNISYNYFRDVMTTLHDGGAIYTASGSNTTADNLNLISNNYAKNSSGATGMYYLDEGTTHFRLTHNVADLLLTPRNYVYSNPSAHTLVIEDNYSSTEKHAIKAWDPWVMRNEHYYTDASWPEDAISIIRNAGLEPRYDYLDEDDDYREINFNYNDITNYEVGDSFNLNVTPFNERGEYISLSDIDSIAYASTAPSVATVDEWGNVKCSSVGCVDINISLSANGMTLLKHKKIYVGDSLDRIYSKRNTSFILKNTTISVAATSVSKLGRIGEIEDVSYESENPELFSIDESGRITTYEKLGRGKILVSAAYRGEAVSEELEFEVIDYNKSSVSTPEQGLSFPPFFMENMLKDVSGWYTKGGADIKSINGGVDIAANAPDVCVYTAEKYQDQLFTVKMNLASKSSGWPSIYIRAQDQERYDKSCYILCFARGEIQLQRFNNDGGRAVIFCNDSMFDNLGGLIGADSSLIPEGKDVELQFGAINEEDGVRLILNINGESIYNVLDDTENRITQPGYFGVVAVPDSMKLFMNK